MTVFEHCRNKTVETHYLNASGTLELEKYCRINTEKLSLRPRTNIRFQSKGIVSLNEKTHIVTIDAFLDKIKEIKVSIPAIHSDDKTVLIHDHKVDFNYLTEKANRLLKETEYETKFKEIHYDNVDTSQKILMISIGINVIFIISVMAYLYFKFYSPKTWANVARILSKNDITSVPKLFFRIEYKLIF